MMPEPTRSPALPDGEVDADFDGHRLIEVNGDGVIVAGHDHLDPLRQKHFAGDVRGPEEVGASAQSSLRSFFHHERNQNAGKPQQAPVGRHEKGSASSLKFAVIPGGVMAAFPQPPEAGGSEVSEPLTLFPRQGDSTPLG